MRTFVIATGNENKVKEFYRMLSPLGYDVKSIKDLKSSTLLILLYEREWILVEVVSNKLK